MNFIVLILLFLILGCEKVAPIRDNPLDDESSNYISPSINFLTDIANGDTVYTETITIAYEGNELVHEFRYKFDELDWTSWNQDVTITLEYLDEGNHHLSAQSRYLSGDTSEIVSISFVVDAVGGPGLIFLPRRHISEQGETVNFKIMAEEVIDLMAAEIKLSFNTNIFQIESVNQGNFFQNGEESIFNYNINTNDGNVEILTSLIDSQNPALSGTGDLFEIEVKILQNSTDHIQFMDGCIFRDPENNDIVILEIINGLIEIK